MKIKSVSIDTVERKRESNTLVKRINRIYYEKIVALCMYENTG